MTRIRRERLEQVRRAAGLEGVSIGRYVDDALDLALRAMGEPPRVAAPIPGQTSIMEELEPDTDQAQDGVAEKGQTGREAAPLTDADEPRGLLPRSSPAGGEAGEAPGACPECAGEMQAIEVGGGKMTTRCEDCGYWGDSG